MPQALIAVAEWVGTAVFTSLPASIGITTAATLANVATAATLMAEVAGIAEIGKMLQPKIGGNFGTQVDFKADPQAGIPYAIGRTGTAGNIVFVDTAGDKNKYLNYVTVLSGAGPIDAIEKFTANDQEVDFTADGGEGASGYYLNRMWQKTQLGLTPEPSYLHFTSTNSKDTPANHGGQPAEWSSSHKLSGFAAALWCLQFNADKYSAGTPKPLWVVRGVRVYDPRLDSTYPGGSGPQRINDESTWAYSENPYLHALTWCLGRFQNGARVAGLGAPAAMIDIDAFVAGANVAGANGWKAGGVASTADDKWQVLQAMLQAGAGKPMRLGAKISCLVNMPRTSIATLTAADVVGEASIAGGISRRDRINTIWPKYRDESQGWQTVTADQPITVTDYYTPDRGMRSRQVDYPLVQSVNQAAVMARYDIEDAREFTPVVLQCKPIWMGIRPGDCITVNVPEYGLNNQKVLVLQRKRDPGTLQVTLTLRSETDGKHAFALGQTGVAPTTPGLTGVDPGEVPIPDGAAWAVIATDLATSDGGRIPAIVIAGAVDSGSASAVLAEYREVLGGGSFGDWVTEQFSPQTALIEIKAVKPQTVYEVRIRYRNARGVEDPTSGADLGQITTGAMVAGDTVNVDGTPASSVIAALNLAIANIATLTNDLTAANDEIASLTTQLDQANDQVSLLLGQTAAQAQSIAQGSASHLDLRNIANDWTSLDGERITVPVKYGKQALSLLGEINNNNSAFVLHVDTVWVNDTQSFAQYQTDVQSTFDNQQAEITLNYSTLSTAQTAMAQAILGTSATLNGSYTQSYINLTSINTITGQLYSSITLKTNADGAIASMQLLSSSGATNLGAVVFDVGSFLVRDSSHAGVQPLYFDATTGTLFSDHLTVRSANIADLSVQTIHIADGSVTGGVSYEVDGLGTYSPGSSFTALSYSYTVNNANSQVQAVVYVEIGAPTSTDCGVTFQIKCDGSVIGTGGKKCGGSWGNEGVSVPFNHKPGAGSHSYSVEITVSTPGGNCTVNKAVLTFSEGKK